MAEEHLVHPTGISGMVFVCANQRQVRFKRYGGRLMRHVGSCGIMGAAVLHVDMLIQMYASG